MPFPNPLGASALDDDVVKHGRISCRAASGEEGHVAASGSHSGHKNVIEVRARLLAEADHVGCRYPAIRKGECRRRCRTGSRDKRDRTGSLVERDASGAASKLSDGTPNARACRIAKSYLEIRVGSWV